MLKPIQEKWPQILGILKSRDQQKWGFIHHSEFMRIIRLAGGCKEMSDSDFLNTILKPSKNMIDRNGFINY